MSGSINGVSLQVYRYGPARPAQILALHGLTGHGKRWQTLADGYLAEYSVLAPDLLGHGHSSWAAPWNIDENVAALATLLQDEADGPVVVVAHSFGGAIALNLAAAHPHLVSGLVLLDPATGLDGSWMSEIADAMLGSPDYPDRHEAHAEKVNGSWGEVSVKYPGELERDLDEHLVALPGGRVGWRISLPAMMSYWSELARPIVLPPHGTPTTLVLAKRTHPAYVTGELVSGLQARLGADFVLTEFDCDHMVPHAMPAETADVIRRHLV
ncbi:MULTISPECIES: alpha/beta hydrolase [unclassified Mycobacterium]|uniref:alpha/beta fold hydrolase n=1 Tax=unclassified Mycobacterium TaxID=2642494 RepID=UPI0003610802|nr:MULTISPECIES: alpha/beta hydrolase [unclassified Mycobacterium]SEA25601.1 lipase [Mycobacterium sp. 283mftsu]